MKKSLRFPTGMVLLLFSVLTSNGQTIVLAENFQGFTTGSHTTPSTSDASASLDLKTSIQGWTGSLIYSAGGEIKIGTSSTPGWIETPAIDLSSGNGKFVIEFDIARWTGDATTVQVYYNGAAIGDVISPTDNFQKIQINGTMGSPVSKIRVQALAKRFFIDNFILTSEGVPTGLFSAQQGDMQVKIYPVPAYNKLIISNIQNIYQIDIHNITGKLVKELKCDGESEIEVDVSELNRGLYFVTMRSLNGKRIAKFLKI